MNAAEYARMDAAERDGWWFRSKRRFVRRLAQTHGLDLSSSFLLDAGCGTGATLRAFRAGHESAARSVGIDASPEALAFAREKSETLFVCGSAEALPIRSESMDVVLMLDVLEHLDNDRGATAEAFRVLRPGGHFLFTVPAFPFLWSGHDVALHHRRRYRVSTIRPVIEGAGFDILYLGHAFALTFLPAACVRIARRLLPDGSPAADVGEAPGWLNTLLTGLLALEAEVAVRFPLPLGTSILGLARKPSV